MYNYNHPNEFYHHGVKGMKWGVRRYQSYDSVPRKSGKGGKEIGLDKNNSSAEGQTRGQKALRIINEEAIKPELKKAAVIAGITAVGFAASYVALNPQVRAQSYRALNAVAKSRTSDVVELANKGMYYTRNFMKSPAMKAGIKVAGTIETARTVNRVHTRFKEEGLIQKKN